jgi:hypothetical protein
MMFPDRLLGDWPYFLRRNTRDPLPSFDSRDGQHVPANQNKVAKWGCTPASMPAAGVPQTARFLPSTPLTYRSTNLAASVAIPFLQKFTVRFLVLPTENSRLFALC